jgi:hypothetical protein
MIIYIDENMPPALAKGLHVLQKPLNVKLREAIDVRSLTDDFGRGVKDEEWIPLAGEKEACIITQDFNIQKNRIQQALFHEYELGIFFFRAPSKSGFSYWEMVKLVTKHWENMTRIALTEKRPFSYRVSSKGKLEKI